MNLEIPLVSIGIPTYNRPDGLRRTLNRIISQTYTNLEIIVSDNCSNNSEVTGVIDEFSKKDHRIVGIRQKENIGAGNNFKFVLDKASGVYFIWAADDDEWLGIDFVDKLVKHAHQNILTFSAALFNRTDGLYDYPLKAYENSRDKFEYLDVLCSNGLGYPVYGLYNLKLFKDHKLNFQFDEDLVYYNEGVFLHKIFLTGLVKYVKDAEILFSTDSIKPSYDTRIDNFVKYFKRLLQLYANTSHLSDKEKSILISKVFSLHMNHLDSLFRDFVLSEKHGLSFSYSLSKDSRNSSLVNKIKRRIVRTAKVFVKCY